MLKLLFALLLIFIVWFWRDSMRARETVLARCHQYCRRYDYQLLDATVAIQRIRPCRGNSGRLALERKYQFEYSIAGVERHYGHAVILNGIIREIVLEQEDGTRILEGTSDDPDKKDGSDNDN